MLQIRYRFTNFSLHRHTLLVVMAGKNFSGTKEERILPLSCVHSDGTDSGVGEQGETHRGKGGLVGVF